MQPLGLFYEIIQNYDDNRYCDLDLCGGSDSIQTTSPIRCHKLVICSLIPDWLEIIDEETDRVDLPDVEHSRLKDLIDGLYAQLAKKHDSWAQFDPALLTFLGIAQKLDQRSRRPKIQPPPHKSEDRNGNEPLITLGGIKIEYDWNPEKCDSIPDIDLSSKNEPSDILDIGEYLGEDDITFGVSNSSERKRKPTRKATVQGGKKARLSQKLAHLKTSLTEISSHRSTDPERGNRKNSAQASIKVKQSKRTALPTTSNSISNPRTKRKRLTALEQNQRSIESTQQTRTIDFESVQKQLQKNTSGSVHVDVTTPNHKPYRKNLTTKSLTVHPDAFFALVGVQRRGSEILGRTLAFTTQDIEAINGSFSRTIEAYMKVFGFARAPLMSANSFYTHAGSVRKTKGKHFVNDLHRKFLYKCTRKDLEDELNQPDVVQGFITSSPTYKDMSLPIENYDICLTNDPLDYEGIIIVGVHKHGVEARQMEIHDITEEIVASSCSRVLTLVWGGGNDHSAFPPSSKILTSHRFNTRLNYTFKVIKRLLATDEEFPRSLPIVTCEICGKRIQENEFMNSLINHKKNHMIEKFKCSCDIKFTSLNHKRKHVEEWHLDGKSRSFEKNTINDLPTSSNQTHICDQCGQAVGSEFALKLHNRRAHRSITCQWCNNSYRTPMAYKKHWKDQHVGLDFEAPTNWVHCTECNEIFAEKIELSKHWTQMHGSEEMRPFKCGLCPKSFGEKPKLKYHVLNVHIKSRPYKCRKEGCSSTFNYCGNMYAHEKKLHGGSLGTAIPLDDLVNDSQLLEMGCQLKPPMRKKRQIRVTE